MRKNLIELLRGGQAHITAKEAFSGIKPELRAVRPAAGAGLHSIYELIEHLRIAQEDILCYTLDPLWKSPDWPDGYWPSTGKRLTEEKWDSAIAGFFHDTKVLIGLVQDTSIDLNAKIPHGNGHTYLREILLVADHNAYHLAQIVLIRKLLGNWQG
ncbi:MAG: DinB family protein [Candidatus Brocadiaceae bacterium]|nr:DinB family protein [Candidatus Brocadiaceae bacterium]